MHRLLGIDAGKSVVRAALIRTTYRRVFVEALGEAAVTDAVSEAEAIRAAVGLHRPDAAAIALSGERSFYRRLELPAAAQKEVENVLGFELEATVPFEMEDAVFDHRLLKRPPGVETLPVFAAVARTDDVRERIAVVREALGIEPERVGLGAVPLANLEAVMPGARRAVAQGRASAPIAIARPRAPHVRDRDPRRRRAGVRAGRCPAGRPASPAPRPRWRASSARRSPAWRNLGGEPLGGVYLVGGGAAQGAEMFLATQLGVHGPRRCRRRASRG